MWLASLLLSTTLIYSKVVYVAKVTKMCLLNHLQHVILICFYFVWTKWIYVAFTSYYILIYFLQFSDGSCYTFVALLIGYQGWDRRRGKIMASNYEHTSCKAWMGKEWCCNQLFISWSPIIERNKITWDYNLTSINKK